MRRNPSPGFTLVELMVVLAVMAVLAIIAVPSFSDFFDRHRVRGAAEDIASMISNARAEAVKNDLDVSIAAVGSGKTWCVGGNAAVAPTGGNPAPASAPCDCSVQAECRIAGQRFAVDSIDYPDVSIGALPPSFTFNTTVGVTSPLATPDIALTSPTGKYDLRVQVNALGQARACTPSGKPTISGIATC